MVILKFFGFPVIKNWEVLTSNCKVFLEINGFYKNSSVFFKGSGKLQIIKSRLYHIANFLRSSISMTFLQSLVIRQNLFSNIIGLLSKNINKQKLLWIFYVKIHFKCLLDSMNKNKNNSPTLRVPQPLATASLISIEEYKFLLCSLTSKSQSLAFQPG